MSFMVNRGRSNRIYQADLGKAEIESKSSGYHVLRQTRSGRSPNNFRKRSGVIAKLLIIFSPDAALIPRLLYRRLVAGQRGFISLNAAGIGRPYAFMRVIPLDAAHSNPRPLPQYAYFPYRR